MSEHPLKRWRRARGIPRWKAAAAVGISPETWAAAEHGYRKAERIIDRLVAVGLVDQGEAEQLKHAASEWLNERWQRAREEVFGCTQ
ncbi:MAG: hypothetical protein IRY86_05450 [Thermorudis peleae]|nr:hypothetical protein [Thermorudis peleae]